jgi:radical SAM protein with 4Fe4S-binding SPASM domain
MTVRGYDSPCCFRSSNRPGELRVLWELTTRCNLGCTFCHTRQHQCSQEQTCDQVLALLDGLPAKGVRDVIFSGGEPLIRPDWRTILRRAHALGLCVDLCTNATLVDDNTAAELGEILSEISVSLDGPTPSVHDRLRASPEAFHRTRDGVAALRRASIAIHAISLVDATNYRDLPATARLLESWGVESITFLGRMAVEAGQTALGGHVDQGDLEAAVARAREQTALPVNTKRVLFDASTLRCPAGIDISGIDAEGRHLPCILLRTLRGALSPTWRAHWESALRSQCAGCPHQGTCGGGCPAAALLQDGELGADPLCTRRARPCLVHPSHPRR